MSSLRIRVDPGAMDSSRSTRGIRPALRRLRRGPTTGRLARDRRAPGRTRLDAKGLRDREKDLEVTDDTIWRIYR